MANQFSVRGNSLPEGGITSTVTSSQSQPLLPDTITLKLLSEKFMEASEQNCVQLNPVALLPNQQISFNVVNVGLGESLELFVSGYVKFQNSAANTVTVNLAPEFPFNLISNIMAQFNGQTVVASLSGYELLAVMAKKYKNIFMADFDGSFGTILTNAKVQSSIAYVTAGENVTLVSGQPSLTGVKSVTIAASSTGQVNFGFYLRLPFTIRDDLLLGLIPMQNNSVNLTIYITTPSILGTTGKSPFYISTIPNTLTVSEVSIIAQPTYNFWALPMPNDAKLYSYLVSHSYMLLSQPNNSANSYGKEALQYSLPNNYYLISLLFTLRDGNDNLLDIYNMIDNPYLSYNGTARVDRRDIKTKLARQCIYYEGAPNGYGQLLWDGADVEYLPNSTNTTKWLNMYLANNPQFVMDLNSNVVLPVKYSVLREQLVPANVQLV